MQAINFISLLLSTRMPAPLLDLIRPAAEAWLARLD
jgi:hypothetical protein